MTLPPTIHPSVPPPAPPAPRSLQPGSPAERALRATVGRAAEVTAPTFLFNSSGFAFLPSSASSLYSPLPPLSVCFIPAFSPREKFRGVFFFPAAAVESPFLPALETEQERPIIRGAEGSPGGGCLYPGTKAGCCGGGSEVLPTSGGVGWGWWLQVQPPDVRIGCGITERDHRHPALPTSCIPRTPCSP